MREVTRRELLAGGLAATAGAVAGCVDRVASSVPGLDAGATERATATGYAAWLGPETADLQWAYYRETDVDVLDGVVAASPAAATAADHLSGSMRDRWRDRARTVATNTASFEFDPAAVDLVLVDSFRSFVVVEGSFDADPARESVSAAAERRDDHRNYAVFVAPVRRDGTPAPTEVWQGFGVGDDRLVVATAAPTADRATEFVASTLDTRDGTAEQYASGDGPTAMLVDKLGDGVYVTGSAYGLDGRGAGGLRLRVSGETAHRRTVSYRPDATPERAAAYRALIDERSARRTPRRRPGADATVRTSSASTPRRPSGRKATSSSSTGRFPRRPWPVWTSSCRSGGQASASTSASPTSSR